jgi:SAM-dependent methyltransferase
MAAHTLLDLFHRLGARPYDWMYRRGAPWESGPRPALVELCDTGRISPQTLAPGLALDLGCGSGADAIFLSQRGFTVLGLDFSATAISKARAAAATARLEQPPVFGVMDLLDLATANLTGPFDLLFDGGTIDDFPPSVRPRIADAVTAVSRPGSVLVMWCFYADPAGLPRFSLSGPSRWGAPPIAPGEESALFGDDWDIERFVPADEARYEACFVMTRR